MQKMKKVQISQQLFSIMLKRIRQRYNKNLNKLNKKVKIYNFFTFFIFTLLFYDLLIEKVKNRDKLTVVVGGN